MNSTDALPKPASAPGNVPPSDPFLLALKREKLRRLYRLDPEYYALTVLGVKWWEKQIEVAQALLDHKRVFVKASHSVGKSFLAGGLVNWFFDCFSPGICLTTAPNSQQVKDILWKEVRVQRPKHSRGALQPKAPRMETTPNISRSASRRATTAGFKAGTKSMS